MFTIHQISKCGCPDCGELRKLQVDDEVVECIDCGTEYVEGE